jgi:preprotein translocase subunit YajC
LNVAHFAYQAVPAAPNPAAPAAPGGGESPAQGPGGAFSLPLMMMMFVPLILVMLWQSRSQQKKQEQVLSSLKKGDRIVTQSGLVGRLAEVDNRYAKVEIAPGVKITVLRTSLAGRDTEDAAKKDDASKKEEPKKTDDSEAKK